MENAGELFTWATKQVSGTAESAIARQWRVIAEASSKIVEMQGDSLPEPEAVESAPAIDYSVLVEKIVQLQDNMQAVFVEAHNARSDANKSAMVAQNASDKAEALLRVCKPPERSPADEELVRIVNEMNEWFRLPWWKRLFK